MILNKPYLFLTLVFCFFSFIINGQETELDYRVFDSIRISYDIFDHNTPLEFTLEFDVKQYQRSKKEDKYLPATLTIHNKDTLNDIKKQVKIRSRGENRKKICAWPPIRLNIKKAEIINENLKDVKNIKLVTHCNAQIKHGEYVLKEFLAYKIYQLISPYSFRVRLVEIIYIDTGRKNKETKAWAFIIEPEIMMAERLNMSRIKLDNIGLKHTDTLTTNNMTMFQYMIGNADYSIAGRHNIKLIKKMDINTPYPIPVPYDFDYAGIVDASYAVPGETLGIKSVTERYFLGPCRDESDYSEVYNYFKEKKESIYALINDFEYLNLHSKKKMVDYLDEFYNQPDNQRYIINSILSTCRDLN